MPTCLTFHFLFPNMTLCSQALFPHLLGWLWRVEGYGMWSQLSLMQMLGSVIALVSLGKSHDLSELLFP